MTEITDIKDAGDCERVVRTTAPAAHGLTPDDVRLFLADWTEALFIHFAVPVETLRPHVPADLEIDTFDGLAYVSLVAFTQRNLRPAFGGRIGRLIATPLAEHAFLNLRTYVRYRNEPGIHFLAEWIPNRLATLIGPRTYGLPYRLARMKYPLDPRFETMSGEVSANDRSFIFEAATNRTEVERHFLPQALLAKDVSSAPEGRQNVAHDEVVGTYDLRASSAPEGRKNGLAIGAIIRQILSPLRGWIRQRVPSPRLRRGLHSAAPPGLKTVRLTNTLGLPRNTEQPALVPTIDDFLLERYTAWTERAGIIRRFRIAHRPWLQNRVRAKLTDRSLFDAAAPWMKGFAPVFANYSPGAFDVEIGRPVREPPQDAPPRNPRPRWLAFVPLIVLPIAALLARSALPTWMFMWLFAAGIFAGCKALTLVDAKRAGIVTPLFRTLGYLFAWVGMDATRWYRGRVDPARFAALLRRETVRAIGNVFVGLILIFGLARFAAPVPYLAGWVGMIGVMLILHFGLFHLLALAWQRAGVDAEPLMNRPAAARSVGEFWSRRWNTGFNVLAERYVFRPLRRRLGPRGALLATFAASGIVHDLVISLPARGGYGLPTFYFLIQGAVVLLERRFRNVRPLFTRIITIAAVVLPAPLLAHPPFVHRVVLPMLRAIGAL